MSYAATASSGLCIIQLTIGIVSLLPLCSAILLLLLAASTLAIGSCHFAPSPTTVDFSKPGGQKTH